MSSGGGTTTQQTSQQSSPWAPVQPYLTDVASQAQALEQSQQGNNQLPSSVAPLSSATQNALTGIQNYASAPQPLMTAADGSLSNLMNPQAAPGTGTLQGLTQGYSDPGTATDATFANPNNINPYLGAEYQAAAKPVIDSVNSIMGLAGRTGSGANQQLLTTDLGNLSAGIYSNGYDSAANRSLQAAGQLSGNALNQANVQGSAASNLNSEFNSQNSQALNADQLEPTVASQPLTSLQALLQAGGVQDTQDNAQLQNILQQYLYGQQQPWNILSSYGGAVTGIGGEGGQSSGTNSTTQPQQSMFPQLLGLGMSAALAPVTGGGSLLGNFL